MKASLADVVFFIPKIAGYLLGGILLLIAIALIVAAPMYVAIKILRAFGTTIDADYGELTWLAFKLMGILFVILGIYLWLFVYIPDLYESLSVVKVEINLSTIATTVGIMGGLIGIYAFIRGKK